MLLMEILEQRLKRLNLSRVAIEIYTTLSKEGALSVSDLGTVLKLTPQGLYRIMQRLVARGFVVELDTSPRQYQARPLESALEHYKMYQSKLADSILDASGQTSQQVMRLLTGRAEIIHTHMQLIPKARHELLSIIIGKPLPEVVYRVTTEAVERGVASYFIVQQHSPENDMRLRRWKALGSQVRLLPGEGFHLHIVDTSYAILAATNTANTEERVAVLISASAVVAELRTYFFSQWEKAQPL